MLNRFLFTLALVAASPAMLFSQDIFLVFDQGPAFSADEVVGPDAVGTAASAFIYVRNGFDLGAFEIDYEIDDTSVAQLTGDMVFNSAIGLDGAFGTRFDQNDNDDGHCLNDIVKELPSNSSGQVVGTSIRGTSQGINSAFAGFDADFNVAADAFLLAQIDFDIVGEGTVSFTMSPANDTAFADLGFTIVNATLAGGTFTIGTGQVLLGDVNLDGLVNFADIAPFIATILNGDFLPEADTNSDGDVNFLDINPLIFLLLRI